ncbi:MAG TPA: putative PEP-binding protein [Noviherbaspirillum sp.]
MNAPASPNSPFIRWFAQLGVDDVPIVGGKNASLGEMVRELGAHGVNVPNGFAITAEAYRYVLDQAGAWEPLHAAMQGLDPADVADMARRARIARELTYGAPLPDDLAAQILDAYAALRRQYGEDAGRLPSHVERIDGFSIGSNDLTQLVLGVDRDSDIVSFDFDELDPGVKTMLRMAIEGARRNGRHCGICGQAPSDYPEMAEYLVELGIDSISLNPDTLVKSLRRVLEVEQKLGRPPRT